MAVASESPGTDAATGQAGKGSAAVAPPEDLRLQGNGLFGQRDYSGAAEKYSAAIDGLQPHLANTNTESVSCDSFAMPQRIQPLSS